MPQVPIKPLLDRSPGGVWLEEARRELLRDRIVESPDIGVNRSQKGTSLYLKNLASAGGGSGGTLTQYLLKDWSAPDFLTCHELTANDAWDGDPLNYSTRFIEGTEDIYIAKPFWLRQSELDGLTITVVVESISGANLIETDTFWKFTYRSPTFRTVQQLQTVGGTVLSTENEIILPRFTEDEIIYASEVSGLQIEDPNDELITLLAELPGRAWAHQFV